MNINDLVTVLFDASTYIVMYDKVNKKTAFKSVLWDRDTDDQLFVELICNDLGELTVNVTASIDSILAKDYRDEDGYRNDYDFGTGNPTANSAHSFFTTKAPQAEAIVGVGDIRNLTAYYHKYILNYGIAITSTANGKVTIFFKNGFSSSQQL